MTEVPTEIIESVLPVLKHKYVIHIYQDELDNWYASIKPDGKESVKIPVEFYLSYLMRKCNQMLHNLEFPES